MIEKYEFGNIIIDGEKYTSDVIILGNKVVPDWWRRVGHSLCPEDLERVIEFHPERLIIGTGASGMMDVPKETIHWLKGNGIEPVVFPTEKACKEYNKLSPSEKKIAACFHLTC